jgi:hypothetical protein
MLIGFGITAASLAAYIVLKQPLGIARTVTFSFAIAGIVIYIIARILLVMQKRKLKNSNQNNASNGLTT